MADVKERSPSGIERSTGVRRRLPRALPAPALPSRERLSAAAAFGARAASRLAARLLTPITGACAAIPIIVSIVHAVQYHWQPTDDKAIIATRAWDVFTGHTPLLGQFSTISETVGHTTYAPGPMLYWLLALPARNGGPLSMAITVGVVNVLCVMGAVALARRRGGRVLMFGAAAAIALMCMSLASESLRDTWGSAAPLFPFLLLLFTSWSIAVGEYKLLPLSVLLASFIVQAHLSYLAPAAGLSVIAIVGLVVTLVVRRRREGAAAFRWRSVATWSVAAVVALGLCWTPAIIDQAEHKPGNLTELYNYATGGYPTLGSKIGWHAVVRTVGLPPWWLYVPKTRWDRYQDVLAPNSGARDASAILAIALLALIAVAAALRRRGDVVVAAVIGLMLCLAVGEVASKTPATPHNLATTIAYNLWWASQAGMWVYLVIAWAGWLVLASVLRPLVARGGALVAAAWRGRGRVGLLGARGAARARALGVVVLSGAGVGAVVVAGVAVAASAKRDQHYEFYAPIAHIDQALNRAIPENMTIRYEGGLDGTTQPLKPSLRYDLNLRGDRVLAKGSFQRLGYWYELYRRPYDMTLYVENSARPPAPRVTLLSHVAFKDAFGYHKVFVWLSRRPGNLGGGANGVSARRSRGRSGRTRRPHRP